MGWHPIDAPIASVVPHLHGAHGWDDSVMTTSLDQLIADLRQLASKRDLTVVPALPTVQESGPLLTLSAVAVSIDWFVDTAVAAGSRLLYARRSRFAVGQLPALAALPGGSGDATASTGVTRLVGLRDRARTRYEGLTCELGVAFIAEGVVHRWTAHADWYERLCDEVRAAIRDGAALAGRGGPAQPPSAGRAWTPDEQARLFTRFGDGADAKTLSAEFGRSPSAIRSRLARLGLLDAR